jgi:hypothetical protein
MLETHLASCRDCREELEGQERVGALLEACFAHRMERARRRPVSGFRALAGFPALALAGTAAVLLALGLWMGPGPDQTAPPLVGEDGIARNDPAAPPESDDDLLFKPDEGDGSAGSVPAAFPADTGFWVMDQAGYAHTLADFGDSVLVLGIFGPEASPESAKAFRELSEAQPASGRIQFLAIGLDGLPSGDFGSILRMVNRGSDLLGLAAGDVAIVTPGGEVFRTGRILDARLSGEVASGLREPGVSE